MTVAAIEAGGTKIICAIGRSVEEIRTTPMRSVVHTTNPRETVAKMASFFNACHPSERVDRVGVGTFGPVDQRTGIIGPTPKPGWSGFSWPDFVETVYRGTTVTVDTDVNAAALAEARHGASRGLRISSYLTVGTGIGGGLVVDNRTFQGTGHPEIGHMLVPRINGDTFAGICPFHADCLEGLASGRAIAMRTGSSPELLVHGGEIWTLEAGYLGMGILNLMTVISPERVVLGGGVMKHPGLLDLVRNEVAALSGGYLNLWLDGSEWETMVVPPELGDDAGVVGAFELTRSMD
jgi:fructokinase